MQSLPRCRAASAQGGGVIIYHKRFSIAVYLATLVALCDQMSKWWLIYQINPPQGGVHVNQFFNLVLVENRGVTFGLMSQFDPKVTVYFFVGIAVIILGMLGRWLWKTSSTLVAVGLGFIIGGAIGNIIDRVRFG